MKVPYSVVECKGNELKYVEEVLKSGWLTTASKTIELEKKIATLLNVKHALAVNSCTSALHLAIEALNVKRGDKVFLPTWTFTASAEVIRYMGADPVFLDVDYSTGLLTPEIVADAIEKHPDVKVLIVVHYAGQPAAMSPKSNDGILTVCRENNIDIIEDAAHAFPAKDEGEYVGTLGDITCLSFYANKTMTTGEGGMLLTNNDDIAKRVKVMRLHGINRDVWDRYTTNKVSWEYDVIAPGFKYNLPDVNAAIGLAQLERVFDMRHERQRCAEYYLENLSEVDSIDLPTIRVPYEDHAWHLFPIVITKKTTISRNEIINRLADDGIGTSVHYKPLHRLSYYREQYDLVEDDFPNAEKLWSGTLSLPIYPSLKEEDLQYVCERLRYHLGS